MMLQLLILEDTPLRLHRLSLKRHVIDLNKSEKSLGAISKQFQVPRSTVHTTVSIKHKLSPAAERKLVRRVKSQPKNHQKASLQGIRICWKTGERVFCVDMSREAAVKERSLTLQTWHLKARLKLMLMQMIQKLKEGETFNAKTCCQTRRW